MPAHKLTPTVRARALGAELERLRIKSNLSPEQVAQRVGGSRWKVRNLEMAQIKPDLEYVEALLEVYGGTCATKALILELAEDSWHRGWWTAYGDVFQGAFVDLEDQACRIRSWQPQLVPGLLQVEEYAREVIRAGKPDAPPMEIDQRWRARFNRQALLTREVDPVQLEVVLGEAILECAVGGHAVMQKQLGHLAEIADRPNVTIQVLPKSAGAHAGMEGPLVILSFAGDIHPDVAYVEGFAGDAYLESTDEIARSNVTMDRIQKTALDPVESVRVIKKLVTE